MKSPPLVFFDANVLFSAALGGPSFELLIELAERNGIHAMTSATCAVEAATNLERKRSDRVRRFDELMVAVEVRDAEIEPYEQWAAGLVDRRDVHVLAAARSLGADVLVTGDVTHFGRLMDRTDLPFKVRTPRAFLLEGPG